MLARHPENTNLQLHYSPHWKEFPVQTQAGPLVHRYLEGISETIDYSLQEFPRTSIFTFTLSFPIYWPPEDTGVISRFIHELTKQLDAAIRLAAFAGKRTAPNRLRYIWAKERGEGHSCHYHVAILLNKDAFYTLGHPPSFRELTSPTWHDDVGPTLRMRIILAWAKALNLPPDMIAGAIWFPENCTYHVNANSPDAKHQVDNVFYRLSYLTKVDTKVYGNHQRNFGCSTR